MQDLKFEIYIAGTPDRVWDAFMSPEGVKKMFHNSTLESTFKPGDPYVYVGEGPNGPRTEHVFGKVLDYEPNKLFRATMRVGEAWGEGRSKFESRVTYQLEPVGGTTKLLVTQDHWTEGDPAYANHTSGWPRLLSNIKTLVETGKMLDLPAHG